ncbi:MAG: aspartate-semialdehyde dehydrogenase [Candidatus Margulisiibacteriota bacterium]
MKQYTVAVVGATGVVGKEILSVLEERHFPVGKLVPLASAKSAGTTVQFKGEHIEVQELKETSFEGVDFALFSAGGAISKLFVPIAAQSGAIAIDNTSYFRMHADIPLVVPEVNGAILKDGNHSIIANPNCSTAQMVVALKPIYDAVGIDRIVVSTYQSVSGAGKKALDELENHARLSLSGGSPDPSVFSHPIAFNVIPQIDVFVDNGYTKEEMKLIEETKKIMGDDSIAVTATAVRVPVFISHSEAVNIQTKQKISAKQVRELLQNAPGIEVMDDPATNTYPTPRQASGKDDVLVGRIREDLSIPNGIELWCVGDNLRKGAALNAVQIAETLVHYGKR